MNMIADLGPLLTFFLVIYLGVELSRVFPRKRGEHFDRWRIILVTTIVVATVALMATVQTWVLR